MKYILRFLLCFCIVPVAGQQLLAQNICTDFDYPTELLNTGSNCLRSFQNSGCYHGPWYAAHGTPNIALESANNYAAAMDAGVYEGEGLFLQCNFQAGAIYRLQFRIREERGNSSVGFYLKMANNMQPHTNQMNHTYLAISGTWSIPVPGQNVAGRISGLTTSWQYFDFRFTCPEDFENLWVYPWASSDYDYIYFDDFCITCLNCDPCSTNVSYLGGSNPPSIPEFTQAGNSITATGPNTVTGTTDVTFRAGDNIHLDADGLVISPSSSNFFHAFIAPCLQEFDCATYYSKLADGSSGELSPNALPGTDRLILSPNPVSDLATLDYSLHEDGPVSISIMNILGQQVQILKNTDRHPGGNFSLDMNLSALPEGSYFIQLRTASSALTTQMLILR